MKKKVKIFFVLIVFSTFAFLQNAVFAAFVCYNERYFPAVFQLHETIDGFEAKLGGVYSDARKRMSPYINWSDSAEGWVSCEIKPCQYCKTNFHIGKCVLDVPPLPFIKKSMYNTGPSACVSSIGYIWFGINFARGGGYKGKGGIGRYQPDKKQLEIHRPSALNDIPIHKVIYDGKFVWAATTRNYNCKGHPPALGLIKYDWDKEVLYIFKGKENGPCGFVIHDLLWRKGSLWVATDIGLSRWDSKKDKWTHYLPDINDPKKVAVNSCSVFYRQLLSTLPKNETWLDESRSYYQVLYDNLKEFRPDFIKEYEAGKK